MYFADTTILMTTTLDKIQKEAVKSYTSNSKLSQEEIINNLLDEINARKKKYKDLAKGINYLSHLLCKITWLDDLKDSDDVLIHSIIGMAKASDKKYREFLARERKAFVPKGLFKEEFKLLKEAIENHKESYVDVSNIVLDLRKDEEFLKLSQVIDEL